MAEIFEKALNYGKDSYMQYKGTGAYFTLFFIALIAIYFFLPDRPEHVSPKSKRNSKLVYCFYYPLIAFLMIFSPLIAGPVVGVITATVYWRIFWIIPMTIIIALAMALLVMKVPAGPKRLLATLGCVVVIWVSGSLMVKSVNYQKPANWFKIPYEAIEICEMIRKDTDGYVNVAVPLELNSYIRQYDASIHMPYGRRPWGTHVSYAPYLSEETTDIDKMKGYQIQYSVNYLVFLINKPEEIVIPDWCELVGVSGNYYLLRVK